MYRWKKLNTKKNNGQYIIIKNIYKMIILTGKNTI